jgi:hypothetical protein
MGYRPYHRTWLGFYLARMVFFPGAALVAPHWEQPHSASHINAGTAEPFRVSLPEAVPYPLELGLIGTWWSGQEKRVRPGISDGKLVVPVDFAMRRPNPAGPGSPCRDKLIWVQVMLDARHAAWSCRLPGWWPIAG